MTRASPRAVSAGGIALAVLLALVLTPAVAHAWTPGTHIFLGEAIMRSLALLPSSVAELLAAFPYDFLYGSIAADTSIAKKYAAAGRHCHSWNVGLEIHDNAESEPLKAFGLGYLAHLAADSVAHNYFVPHQLTITSSTAALGHSYWESRFDTHIGERFSRTAKQLILRDHSHSDEHLDRILSPTIFSTPTNRRIFRGMVYVADTESWQRIFHLVEEKSRWDLTEQEVEVYMARAFDYIVDLLTRLDRAEPYKLDPAGTIPLRAAKKVRRAALRRGGEEHVHEQAQQHFGMPPSALHYAVGLPEPLYPPRVDNN
ncbi:MAG TPA: zinc dependent phospholipase C family protein [Gemmatimonadaceae bacterium]|nr:zinc dependent phospholipase C family protein [Gemmatimonadaceae bacterium]